MLGEAAVVVLVEAGVYTSQLSCVSNTSQVIQMQQVNAFLPGCC